jgi:hypothetical protein
VTVRRLARAAGGAAAVAALLAAGPAPAQKTQPQRFFEQRLLDDRETSRTIKDLLRRGGGFVDRSVVFRDLNRDRREDAVVRVHSGGEAGVVAVYVFSSAKGEGLQAVFRSESLTRASTRVSRGVLSYRTARYEPDDELCCPARLAESTLAWDRRRERFRVASRREIVPEPQAEAPTAP